MIEVDEADQESVGNYDRHFWRKLVIAVHDDSDDELEVEADSKDLDDWQTLMDAIEERILWDNDWSLDHLYMDVEPECGKVRKEIFGIDCDYYSTPAPDMRDGDEVGMFAKLKVLVSNN